MNDRMINLFTHTDLDGIGCSVLMHLYAAHTYNTSLSVAYCDYDNINKKVSDFIDLLVMSDEAGVAKPQHRDIIITDISLNEETAKKLDKYLMDHSFNITVHLLDHHKTAEWMAEKYPWAYVNSHPEVCGTSLVYDKYFDTHLDALDEFVNAVCLYDTWRCDQDKLCLSKQLNYLSQLYGYEDFVSYAISQIEQIDSYGMRTRSPHFILSDELWGITYGYDQRIQKYIDQRVLQSTTTVLSSHPFVAVATASKYFSQIGHKLIEKYPAVDFAMVLDFENGKAHLRGGDGCPDLGAFAKKYGGGGHPKAASFPFLIDGQNIRDILFMRYENKRE